MTMIKKLAWEITSLGRTIVSQNKERTVSHKLYNYMLFKLKVKRATLMYLAHRG